MKKTPFIIIAFLLAALLMGQLTTANNTNVKWSYTKQLTAEENATAHWEKHKDEFPEFSSAAEYIKAANDFINNPPKGTKVKIEKDGDVLFYHPATNVFAVRAKTGVPRTMFKPDAGIDYWNRQ